MSATTTARPSHAATAATAGGVLWALVPVAFTLVDPQSLQRGTLAFVAVANYVSSIFAKLQVADRAEAMIRAREAGLG